MKKICAMRIQLFAVTLLTLVAGQDNKNTKE